MGAFAIGDAAKRECGFATDKAHPCSKLAASAHRRRIGAVSFLLREPPPMVSPIPLFPPAPSISFTEDDKLKRAVATARDELKDARRGTIPAFRLAIIDLAGNPLKWGAHEPDTMDFIASEAKIIALYGAFALRDLVRRFAAAMKVRTLVVGVGTAVGAAVGIVKPSAKPAKPVSLFDALRAEIDPAILAIAHPLLGSTKRSERLPIYERMFVAPTGGVPDFTGQYKNWLRAMIVPSSNTGAMECIHGIGYAYLNGAMKEALLFKEGIGPWLAGDFIGKYTYARIDSQNDQAVAQAGTALSIAKLMAIIVRHGVVLGADAFTHMENLLHDAVSGPDTPFLTRNPPDFTDNALRIPRDKITHIKLGLADLKAKNGGQSVGSEVWRLEGLFRADKVYALSYQNLDWTKTSSEDVAYMIRRSIQIYET